MTLRVYTFQRLGKRRVNTINSADVLAVLTPIWNEKPETAKRVRQRISAVMDWAVGSGFRQENPAGAALTKVLPKRAAKHENMKALPTTRSQPPLPPYESLERTGRRCSPLSSWC